MAKRRNQGEGSVYYDESRSRWVGQVWIDDRRRKVSAKTKTECSAKLGALLHGDDAARRTDRRLTVATLLDDWQGKHLAARNLAPSTREAHRWAAGLWCERIGTVKVSNLDAPMVEAAMAKMGSTDKPLSRASLIKARSTLRQALAWAERRRLVAHNAAAAAELPSKAAGTKERRALTPDELDKLTRKLSGHRWAAMFALSARVGLRPGEAAGVCVDALDLDATPPTVAVIRAVQLEGGRPHLVDDLKTQGARRVLAMPTELAEQLAEHIDRRGITEGPLFATSNGVPPWPSSVRSELADACTAAGLEPITPNELRHTAATIMADAGLSPHLVADILGHRSTRMVDAVYRHRPTVIGGADTV